MGHWNARRRRGGGPVAGLGTMSAVMTQAVIQDDDHSFVDITWSDNGENLASLTAGDFRDVNTGQTGSSIVVINATQVTVGWPGDVNDGDILKYEGTAAGFTHNNTIAAQSA
jgi:hypothetical protein